MVAVRGGPGRWRCGGERSAFADAASHPDECVGELLGGQDEALRCAVRIDDEHFDAVTFTRLGVLDCDQRCVDQQLSTGFGELCLHCCHLNHVTVPSPLFPT